MSSQTVTAIIPTLQTAIGPAILISGVGLLLLTMTNRLGRAIDRARILAAQLPAASASARETTNAQLRILWRRAGLIRLAITLASTSALGAAILVLTLFCTALWQVESSWLVGALFFGSIGCLIASLGVFISDINLSLMALKIELFGDQANRR